MNLKYMKDRVINILFLYNNITSLSQKAISGLPFGFHASDVIVKPFSCLYL
jgi:hypothetical protein